MSGFAAIQDMSSSSSIFHTLREVGQYFHHHTASLCQTGYESEALDSSLTSLPDEACKNAATALHPLAYHLQNRAQEEQKEELGEMLAADSNVVEHLCKGILYPFINETNMRGPREIKKADYLALVRLVHVCLMECSENLRLRRKLIESGCIHLLLKELRNMIRLIQTDAESNKFARQLIQLAALVTGNCLSDNVDLYMRLHPDTDITGAFSSYFNYPDSIVRLVCQLTYYQFSYYLDQSNPGSINCPDVISDLTRFLCFASESKQFVARVDSLFLDATDILKALQCLCTSTSNRRAIFGNAKFNKAVTNLLIREGEKQIECALNLLLTYLTEGQLDTKTGSTRGKEKKGQKQQPKEEYNREQARRELLSQFPELVHQLESMLANQHKNESVRRLCSAVLWNVQADSDSDIRSCLLYVECCYDYKHYEECCYWSDHIAQQCSTNAEAKKLRDHFLLYKAKAKYHLYQSQHVVLRRAEKLQNRGDMTQDRERVYENTKEVISILGSLKAKNFPLDLECEQFLDYALMDYTRELNKRSSKDSLYCMLCHKKQPIVRSHTIPEALLNIIFEKDQEIAMMGPSSLSLDSRIKTAHTVTFNMLCNMCDNEILSRDENLFIENVAKPVYQTSPGHFIKIAYDKWLHSFCAGIIFRSLALTRGVTGSTNANDIHELFRYCRSIVKPSAEADNISATQFPVDEERKLPAGNKEFSIAIFVTPSMPEDQPSDQKENPSNLIRALNSNVFHCLSNVPISNIPFSLGRKRYFFAVHFGIFTIVAFLEPIPSSGYHQFLVNPSKGELIVPANDDRLCLIPPGLLRVFKEQTVKVVKRYHEWVVEANQDVKEVSLKVLKSNIAEKPTGKPTSFCLLPPKYELNRQTNVLTMKEGHSILLHHTYQLPSACHTVFLAVEEKAPLRPYVILHNHLDAPNVSQTLGYFISLPEFSFKEELDANHSVLMKHIRAKDLDIFKLPAKVIPAALECAGLQNYQSILYHLNRNLVFDRKCIPGDGCWYCCHKCDICMSDSTAGLSISTQSEENAEVTLRFHNKECKAFVDHSCEFQTSFLLKEPLKKVVFPLLPTDGGETPSGEITAMHLLSITLSYLDGKRNLRPTHAVVDIYRVEKEGNQLPLGHYIALFEVRTNNKQVFDEFFLTDELQLGKPLPHVKAEQIDKEQVELLSDTLREVIQGSGHDMDYIRSLGLQATKSSPEEESPAQETSPGEDDSGELIGLDF